MVFVVQIVIMLVMALIQYALRPKPPKPNPDSNLDVSAITDGTPILIIFGDVNFDDNQMLWYGDEYSTPIRTLGGKK